MLVVVELDTNYKSVPDLLCEYLFQYQWALVMSIRIGCERIGIWRARQGSTKKKIRLYSYVWLYTVGFVVFQLYFCGSLLRSERKTSTTDVNCS
jgi:hypothetical protein